MARLFDSFLSHVGGMRRLAELLNRFRLDLSHQIDSSPLLGLGSSSGHYQPPLQGGRIFSSSPLECAPLPISLLLQL